MGRTNFAIRSKGHWLIEGAWTYRMPARVSRKLHDRNEKLPPAIRDIAWKGQLRLCDCARAIGG